MFVPRQVSLLSLCIEDVESIAHLHGKHNFIPMQAVDYLSVNNWESQYSGEIPYNLNLLSLNSYQNR